MMLVDAGVGEYVEFVVRNQEDRWTLERVHHAFALTGRNASWLSHRTSSPNIWQA